MMMRKHQHENLESRIAYNRWIRAVVVSLRFSTMKRLKPPAKSFHYAGR